MSFKLKLYNRMNWTHHIQNLFQPATRKTQGNHFFARHVCCWASFTLEATHARREEMGPVLFVRVTLRRTLLTPRPQSVSTQRYVCVMQCKKWKPLLPRRVFTHGAATQHSPNNGEFSIFHAVMRCNVPCAGRALACSVYSTDCCCNRICAS